MKLSAVAVAAAITMGSSSISGQQYLVDTGQLIHKVIDVSSGTTERLLRQTVTHCTNILQEEIVNQIQSPTQTVIRTWGTMRDQNGSLFTVVTQEWLKITWEPVFNRVRVESNFWHEGLGFLPPNLPFFTIGFMGHLSQGIMVGTEGRRRYSLRQHSTARLIWPTNSNLVCTNGGQEHQTWVWLFSQPRDVTVRLLAKTDINPGESLVVKFPGPISDYYDFRGTDKCVSCGPPCASPSWPPMTKVRTAVMSMKAGKPSLWFAGLPGSSVGIYRSHGGPWGRVGSPTVGSDGEGEWSDSEAVASAFYQVITE